MPTRAVCDEAWPGGLKYGVLIECERKSPTHGGKHISKTENMQWWNGVLTIEEQRMRDELRKAAN